jgi:membrane carboxypeptidase/penicillin-binding protein PbpC
MDPKSGEVLALTGPAGVARPAGEVLAPFVYLSAFSRGYTPATMVVDGGDGTDQGGPLRLRTALASGDANVTRQLDELLGRGAVDSTFGLMGLTPSRGEGDDLARLTDVAAGLGLLATGGLQAGAVSDDGIKPSTILAVYSAEGELLYQRQAARRSVISEGLAFLLNDILADEAARPAAMGTGSALDIGRPAAAVTSTSPAEVWTMGYTPDLVGGAWVGAEPGEVLAGVNALNGAAPIWHALLRYASRDLPSETWTMPADVTEIEVCDPSGYLPTPYCPRVVREVFLAGTEPTNSDPLYRPFRINKETGRLATYFTPLDQVEEVVYFVPPPEAEAWARSTGVQAPPSEYDRIPERANAGLDAAIEEPGFFDLVAGQVAIRGRADGSDFESYRLDIGQGLDPRSWTQIGEEQRTPVGAGRLGIWDTSGLSGAAIIRLSVIHQDGTVTTAAVPVTVDNEPPTITMTLPAAGATFAPSDREVAIQVAAADDTQLDHVVVYVDDRPVLNRREAPWLARWPIGGQGKHVLRARAFDAAGNWADSEVVEIQIVR